MDRLDTLRAKLATHNQQHALTFFGELSPDGQERLLDQLEGIDLARLDGVIDRHARRPVAPAPPEDLQPAPFYPRDPGDAYDADHYRRIGQDLIRAGKVAAFCVAGGQATRLGWSGPKGTFPATVVTGKPLFRVLAEQVVATRDRYGAVVPLYVMTSPLNDAATRAFMQDNNCFGLLRRNLFMFPQGLMPSFSAETGRLLLADKGTVAMNPDGHGGSLRALAASGALDDMRARGIEFISYFGVDNPLIKAIDPLFLGLHAEAPDSSAEISSKMVQKTCPDEKVGVFCRTGGKTIIVEYIHLPPQLAAQRGDDGRLSFNAGSIASHLLGVQFVAELNSGGSFALPLHPALKTVPYVDPHTATTVTPDKPNAIKLESFVFDALPLARSPIVFETSRQEEFAPIKNASGEDSPATSHQLQSDRSGAWLESFGVGIPRDDDGHVAAAIELSPLTALEREDLARLTLPAEVGRGESIVL